MNPAFKPIGKYLCIFLLLFIPSVLYSQQKKHYDIGMLFDNMTSDMNPLLLKLQKQIKAVVGEDAVIDFSAQNLLANHYDLEQAQANYERLIHHSDVDMIIAFGPVNNRIISTQTSYPKPTILFGAVDREFLSIDERKKTSGIDNFTYLIESQSYKEDLATFKQLVNFSRVGIALDKGVPHVLSLKEIFDKQFQELRGHVQGDSI